MPKINFATEQDGFNKEEVLRYIEMLTSEYQNAVLWGEELEKKLDDIEKQTKELGMFVTIDENNQNDAINMVFNQLTQTVKKVKEDAQNEAQRIIHDANEKGQSIVKTAMERSVNLREQNDKIMENLTRVGEMIDVVTGKTEKQE